MKRIQLFLMMTIALLSTQTTYAAIHLPPKMVKSPADISYEFGTTGNKLIWVFDAHESADYPTTYSVTIDGKPLSGHTKAYWEDNVDIVVTVDGLSVGEHAVKITVNDNGVDNDQAAAATDTAIVTVTEKIIPTSSNDITSTTTSSSSVSSESSVNTTTSSSSVSSVSSVSTSSSTTSTSNPTTTANTETTDESNANLPILTILFSLGIISIRLKRRKA